MKNTERIQEPIRRVGFIGLGVMGGAMCRNIIRRDLFAAVEVFDPNSQAVEAVISAGGALAESSMAIAEHSDAIVLSLPDGKASEAVVAQMLPHLRAGQLIIDTSTIPVRMAQQLSALCEGMCVDYLDAPVARTREAAEAGTLSVMVGGRPEAFERAKPLLNCIASDITHCGVSGNGQVVKILNNMVLFQTVNALSEALAIGERAGVDGRLLFDVFSMGSADSFALRNHGAKALLPKSFPDRAFSIAYARKDNMCALELAEQVSVAARGAELLDAIFSDAMQAGLSDQYFPVIHELHK